MSKKPKKDDCIFKVSNHGGGAIVELYIVTHLSDDSDLISGSKKSTQLSRADSNDGGKIIGPNEKEVRMKCCPQFEFQSKERTTTGDFSEITTSLNKEGVDKINVQISLTAADEFGNPSEKELFKKEIKIHSNRSLAETDVWKNN